MLNKFSLHANKMTEFITIDIKEKNMIHLKLASESYVYFKILSEETCLFDNHVMNFDDIIDFSTLIVNPVDEVNLVIYIIDGMETADVELEYATMLKSITVRGDFHSHSNASGDGRYTIDELTAKAKIDNLDFITITDHNSHAVNFIDHDSDLLIIPGMELTNKFGHCNILGKKQAIRKCKVTDYPQQLKTLNEARTNGATLVANHPFSPKSRSWMVPIMEFTPDLVEIWNGPWGMHNRVAFEWWLDILNSGKYIPAIGGSDFHFEDEGKKISIPINIVDVRFKSSLGILDATLEGKNAISNTDIDVNFDTDVISIKNVDEPVYLYMYERYKVNSIKIEHDTEIPVEIDNVDNYLVIALCSSNARDREYIYISNPLIIKE